ncbi:MAG: glutaredoxin family protein [Terriglobales bacterium]
MSTEIELFYSPYCGRCAVARRRLRALLCGPVYGNLAYRERNVLEHLERAVDLGVTATPALAIGGQLVAAGSWQERRLRALLAASVREGG